MYDNASGCTGSAQPGVKEFMSWYLGAYKGKRNPSVANLGIYNCKRLGSGWSLHAEGRAADIGTKPYSRPGAWMWTLLNALKKYSKPLGVQLIIHEGKIWSANHPHAGWRKHTNRNDPHNGHAHVEFNKWAARDITAEFIEAVLHGIATESPNPPAQQPPANTDRFKESLMALPTIKRGSKGEHVKTAQGLLNSFGYGLKIDADFGPKTESATKRFQVKYKVPNSVKNGNGDGLVGPSTRIYLNRAD